MKVIQVSKNFTGAKADLKNCGPDELVFMVDVDRCISCGSCVLACRQENGGPMDASAVGPIKMPATGRGSRVWLFNLPSSCRGCDDPCEYHSEYNFWATCPSSRVLPEGSPTCGQCTPRIEKGYMPACATRCTMKCIYIGRAGDVTFTLGEKRLRGMGDVQFGVQESIS